MADENEDDTLEEKETRRNNRKKFKEMGEDMAENKQEMKNVHSSAFAKLLKTYEEVGKGMVDPNTRELIAGASVLRQLTGAVKDQAQSLCDVSARFSWQDLSASISNKFRNGGANGGLNWEKLGSEARYVFNATPSFTTMVGPIHKEERVRKIAVRRQRENLAGVVNATSENVENDENDGNDEATNARVANLLKHLESYEKEEFDLLKTLVDPVNPVQSVENFFDYSYLHKEKRVLHKFDEASGTLKACIAEPEDLEKRQKKQMVLSFNMMDMKQMAKILYPEGYEGASSDDAASSRHSGASQSTRSSQVSHPLHREDPLYDALDAQEQVRILAERTAQQKAHKKEAAGAPDSAAGGAARSQSQRPPASQSTARRQSSSKNKAADEAIAGATQAQSSSSRRTTSHDQDEEQQNGSSSSRHSTTHPSNVYTADGKVANHVSKKTVPVETGTETGVQASASRRTGAKKRVSSPELSPTPPRPARPAPVAVTTAVAASSTPNRSVATPVGVIASGDSRQSTRSNTPSPSVPTPSLRNGAIKRELEHDQAQSSAQPSAKRRVASGAAVSSPVLSHTPARPTTGGNPSHTLPLPASEHKNGQK